MKERTIDRRDPVTAEWLDEQLTPQPIRPAQVLDLCQCRMVLCSRFLLMTVNLRHMYSLFGPRR